MRSLRLEENTKSNNLDFLVSAVWVAKKNFTLKEYDLSKEIYGQPGWVPELFWGVEDLKDNETGREWKVEKEHKFYLDRADDKYAYIKTVMDDREIIRVRIPIDKVENYFTTPNAELTSVVGEDSFQKKTRYMEEIKKMNIKMDLEQFNLGYKTEGWDDVDIDKKKLAEDPNTPPEVLLNLASDPDSRIRQAVAQNIKAPPEALKILARDRNSDVRWFVAANKACPLDVLQMLALDPDVAVRIQVAKNPNVDLAVLKKLAKDRDWGPRKAVVQNEKTPYGILVMLEKDPVRDVARAAERQLDVLQKLAKDESFSVRSEVANNPKTPEKILRVLRYDRHRYVSAKALKNLEARGISEDIDTDLKIFRARAGKMSDAEVAKEYGVLIKKYGKRDVEKKLGDLLKKKNIGAIRETRLNKMRGLDKKLREILEIIDELY